MQVFLVRHGTRNFTIGDVPLNEEGLEQANELAQKSGWGQLQAILTSPKKRAKMTVEPLAEKFLLSLQVFEELDQMRGAEGEAEFKARVRNFLHRVEEKEFGEKVLICTHSDWLSMAVQIVPTESVDLEYKLFQCAEVLTFKIKQGLWEWIPESH